MSGPGDAATGRYRLERELGRHGSAVTYLATDPTDGRRLVLKRFRLHGSLPTESPAIFEERARILARLRHPGIQGFVAFSRREEGGDTVCDLVLEHAEGESLAALAAAGRRLAEPEVRGLLRQGAAALAWLHGQDPPLLHRNIRPSNLILAPDGTLRLTDLEFLARPVSVDPVVTFGVPWLIGGSTPPEALAGEYAPASDVYSLGVAAIVALSGREPPFRGAAAGGWRAGELIEASPELVRLVERMTAPEPSARFAAGAALAAALAPPPAPVPAPAPSRRRAPLRAPRPGTVARLAVLAALLLVAHRRWEHTWEWLHPEVSGPVVTPALPPQPRAQAAGARLVPGRETYAPGEGIVIAYAGMPGSATDWITLVREDAAADTYAEWHYTGGAARGALTFAGLPAGRYEARAYFDWPRGGYAVRARVPVTVVGP